MSLLISVNKLQKTMGSRLLFNNLSFGIEEREQLGLLGPNGAGKSTLLRMLADEEVPDEGEISRQKGLSVAFVKQEETFDESLSIQEEAIARLQSCGIEAIEAQVQAQVYLTMAGFEDLEEKVSSLSGGWRKRLSLSIAFAQEPDLLILDEPTNHMDWNGILWLESQLQSYRKSFILVSHDRTFLNNVCNKTMEINFLYRDGFLAFDGAYDEFVRKKQEYIQEQINLQSTLSNKARREVEWLRAGVKARTTKSQARIKKAHQLLEDLANVKSRNQAGQSKIRVEIDSAGKQSKKFIELKNFNLAYGENCLIKDLNLVLGPKSCLGLVGENGSGKSSLLKVIAGLANNYSGHLFRADDLKVIYFDQKRDALPQDINLMEFLGDGSDTVIFKGKAAHVASYASRFLFTSDKMKLKIAQLSGGEQARLLIAKLLLEPADVLILDEPTNDLDIDSIEILEESLASFESLVILVSHDRYFLSQLCDKYLALYGQGDWQIYADLNQWLNSSNPTSPSETASIKENIEAPKNLKNKKAKLSYKEKRQMETIEKDIEIAERDLEEAQATLSNPDTFAAKEFMQETLKLVEDRQKRVDELYKIWASIEEKL